MKDSNHRVYKLAAFLLIMVLLFAILKELQAILIPLILSIILYFIFEPLFTYLVSRKIPKVVAIAIVVIIILGLVYAISIPVTISAGMFSDEFPKYEQKLTELIQFVFNKIDYSTAEINKIKENLSVFKLLQEGSVTSFLSGLFSGFLGLIGNAFMVLLFMIFLFAEMDSLMNRINAAFKNNSDKINNTINKIFKEIKKYLVGKSILAFIQGVLFTVILLAFGVDFAILWGLLCFLADFIPNIGSMIATAIPFIVSLFQFDSLITPIIIFILLLTVQNVISNIIEPKFMGDRLNLSPLLIIIALVFWGFVWGIPGMILAVPLLSMMKIVFMTIRETRQAAVIFSKESKDVKNVT